MVGKISKQPYTITMHVHSNLKLKVADELMNTSVDTGRPLCVSGAIVDWNLSINLLFFMEEVQEVQMNNAVNSWPKAPEVCMSIQIH